ncbi:hypothetical protein PG991_015306 [Apiospora marii]|uniref:Carrier domain-containing protein n=1 Tax=Apiospora marii TaxID=335849 RepID=A0ABR1R1Z5_9PEZI
MNGLRFNCPSIPVELATEVEHSRAIGNNFVPNHMRNSVYFHHAVQRLSSKYAECVWLEAEFDSTVTNMANPALHPTVAESTVTKTRSKNARARERYQSLVSGHKIAQTAAICPATVEVEMVIEARMSLRPDFKRGRLGPKILGMHSLVPAAGSNDHLLREWDWKILSNASMETSKDMVHVTGEVVLSSPGNPQDELEFSRSATKESTGRVEKKYQGDTWLDAKLSDCFSQRSDELVFKLRLILADLFGLETDNSEGEAELADLGIDSLVGLELASAISTALKCHAPSKTLVEVVAFGDLVQCVQQELGIETGNSSGTDASELNGQNDDGKAEGTYPFRIPSCAVLRMFAEIKLQTHGVIRHYKWIRYMEKAMPAQRRIPFLQRLIGYLYDMLEKEAGLVERHDGHMRRTSVQAPLASSADILELLLREYPDHHTPHKVIHFAGSSLAQVLSDDMNGIQGIFGSDEGRTLAFGLYGDSPLNLISYKQVEEFFRRLVPKLP